MSKVENNSNSFFGFISNWFEKKKELSPYGQMYTLYVCFLCVFGLFLGGVSGYLGFNFHSETLLKASLIPLGFVMVSIVNFIFWPLHNRFSVTRFIQVLFSISLPFLFQWYLGGYQDTGLMMIWSLVILVTLPLIGNMKSSSWWVIPYIALIFITFWYDDFFKAEADFSNSAPEVINLLFIINFSICSIFIFALGMLAISNLRAREKDLETKNELLLIHEAEIKFNYQKLSASESEQRKLRKELEFALSSESDTREEIEKNLNSKISLKNEQIMASLNYAKRIQSALLVPISDFCSKFDDAFLYYIPRDVVSGDFYWYDEYTTPSGVELQIIAAVDCTGHGVPGALMSMIGLEQLTEIVNKEHIVEPHKILNRLHRGVVNILRQTSTDNKDGMDMGLVVINKQEKTISFSGAKNPMFFIQDGVSTLIKGDAQPIGMGLGKKPHRDFLLHTVPLKKNTILYLYSDGFQDQFGGPNDKRYMSKKFRRLLEKNHKRPMREQKDILSEEFNNWKGKNAQIDDVMVMGVKLS